MTTRFDQQLNDIQALVIHFNDLMDLLAELDDYLVYAGDRGYENKHEEHVIDRQANPMFAFIIDRMLEFYDLHKEGDS